MAETTPQEGSGNDFVFDYNSTQIPISKFKFALYSNKFRTLPEFIASTTLTLTGEIPFATFAEFVKGAQGEPFELTTENAYDILCLSEDWETTTLSQTVLNFLNNTPDCEKIVQLLSERNKNGDTSSPSLEEVVARHLDVAIQLPSFANFSLSTLARIFANPNAIVNQHQLYNFIMSMFEKYGQSASVLAPYLDIRKLTPEETEAFLSNSNLVNSFVNDSLNATSLQLMKENEKLKQKEAQTGDILNMILERIEMLEAAQSLTKDESDSDLKELSRRVAVIESSHDDSAHRFEELEISINTIQNTFKNQLVDVEKKAHKDVRKTNKIVNGLTRKSVAYDRDIQDLKTEQTSSRNRVSDLVKSTNVLRNTLIEMQEKSRVVKTTNIPFDGRSFNGVLKHLSDECHGNVHTKGEVIITSSTSDHNEAYQVADMGWSDFFFTENKINQWISFNFKDRRVKILHYTIKTHKFPNGAPHLKSWVVEGSNDEVTWTELDKRAITVLNGANRFQTFPCKNGEGKYRLIRLRQVGLNARGDNILAINNFEMFGQLFTPEE
ncbi:F5/8 type C domain containing protein [Tritrichomonas foetus]|uniref:F5/8 type C domain containing protein n=1 Tax=Tritrichomonas foetus TaxID=1144522 RepID=A0A1J4JLC1_9EUKA|nr:F5/8 type C domain containing protein [Tritrichomonas foetus]|eukprot:OHS98349.1 F5/8 type C domain containing protein [Tritrichomonas foetus]